MEGVVASGGSKHCHAHKTNSEYVYERVTTIFIGQTSDIALAKRDFQLNNEINRCLSSPDCIESVPKLPSFSKTLAVRSHDLLDHLC